MYTAEEIMKVMRLKGYTVFENDSKPFNMNYVGIRDSSDLGKFNDLLFVFWKYKGQWNFFSRWGTTDPGRYYEQHILNKDGVAILKEGQYPKGWTLGLHQKKYEALVQNTEVTVIRDANKDGVLDLDSGTEDTGWFGINHHRSHADAEVSKVGKYSAGCQVTHNPNEYDVFLAICRAAEDQWGKGITYTLLNKDDFR